MNRMFFYCISYWSRIKQPDTLQHNGMTNSEMEISCFVSSNWKLLSLKMRRADIKSEVIRQFFLQKSPDN